MENIQYAIYLRSRSLVGNLYRKYWLYPQLTKCLQGKALDVGCGIGDMLSFRPSTVDVDIKPHNVSFCKQIGPDGQVTVPDLLPFGDTSFDSVLLDNILDHKAESIPLLDEIHRVLRPQGVVVIGLPGLRGQTCDSDYKVFYDEIALAAIADRNGFEVVNVFHMPFVRSLFLGRHFRQDCIYSLWQLLTAKYAPADT